ncbi:MAG: trigger factor [Clostridia bacterium]|nr:trigger factor [Clostridia bacterium]
MSLISTNKVEENRVKLEVSISPEDFAKAIETAYRKAVKTINVPGFRKGKAPRALIEKMYGDEVFFEDAVNEAYPEALSDAIEESGLTVIRDSIDLDVSKTSREEGVVFTAVVTTYPEVSISKYKGLEATKKLVVVAESQVDEEIDRVRDRNSRMVEVTDRPTKNGDTVVFDFEGFCDGEAFEGGKAENFSLVLGSGQFIPGFEEQMEGKNPGDEFDVNVTFPEDYHEGLAGKDAVFKIKLHEVKEKELPELDDDFAKDVSEFDTLEEYRNDIRAKIMEREEHEAEHEVENNLHHQLIDNLEANIPEAMFENKCDDLVRDMEARLNAQGLSMDVYMQYTNSNIESIRESMRPRAEESVKLRLALEKIAQLEGFEISDEELEAEYTKISEMVKRDIEEVKAAIDPNDLKGDLLTEKAVEFVKENAVITQGE